MRTSELDTSFTSTSNGMARDSATSASRSTSADLLIPCGMLSMITVFLLRSLGPDCQVPRTLSVPWPVS
jgi:hypothetical protein